MDAALATLLARAAFIHHDNLLGMYQPQVACIMLECSLASYSPGLHHDDQGHNALKQYAAIKGLT